MVMPGLSNAASQFRPGRAIAPVVLVSLAALSFAGLAQAQIHGIPPLATSIPNHTYPYLPNTPASVTSLGPYGYCCTKPWNVAPVWGPVGSSGYGRGYGRGQGRGRGGIGGYGYGYATGAAVPYYYMYPAYDPGYYDDPNGGGGGSYLSSGPPQGGPGAPAGQMPIIVEQPPVRQPAPIEQASVPAPEPVPQLPEVTPGLPTVLVFRDGHKQKVTNYAIMGQTVYVFDKGNKKIALADLDVPATIKANDDEGIEFQLPKSSKQSSKPAKGNGVPLQSAPDDSPKALTNSASATP